MFKTLMEACGRVVVPGRDGRGPTVISFSPFLYRVKTGMDRYNRACRAVVRHWDGFVVCWVEMEDNHCLHENQDRVMVRRRESPVQFRNEVVLEAEPRFAWSSLMPFRDVVKVVQKGPFDSINPYSDPLWLRHMETEKRREDLRSADVIPLF